MNILIYILIAIALISFIKSNKTLSKKIKEITKAIFTKEGLKLLIGSIIVIVVLWAITTLILLIA
jgi:hypothetical protein